MRSLPAILIILTFFPFALTLTTQSTSSLPYYSSQQYSKTLDNTQLKFENQLSVLNQQVAQIDAIIQDSNKTTNVKITSLNEKLADERNQIYNIEQYLKIPYKLKVCSCKTLTTDQKYQLQAKVNELNTNINSLQQDLNACNGQNCTQYTQIRQQINNMRSYSQYIQEILNSDCCKLRMPFKQENAIGLVDLSNTLYKDNLKATNWYYGTIKEEDYKLQMFELSTKFNVTTCPLSSPYANIGQNKCEKCKDGMFNLGTRSCYSCGGTSFLNTTTSLCQSCPSNQYYNSTLQMCQTCPKNNYLNKTTQKCQACPTGQVFNPTISQCVGCPSNYEYDLQANTCRLCNNSAGQYYNSTTYKCSKCASESFYNTNNKKCQKCPSNTFYNATLGQCLQCPTGFKYDSVYQLCVSTTPGKNAVTNPTITNPNINNNIATQHVDPINGACPSNYPYYNKIQNKCQKCPLGQYLDTTSGKCLTSNNIGICPDDRPYFNIKLNQCVPCPAGTTYNPYHYICVNSQGQTASHFQAIFK